MGFSLINNLLTIIDHPAIEVPLKQPPNSVDIDHQFFQVLHDTTADIAALHRSPWNPTVSVGARRALPQPGFFFKSYRFPWVKSSREPSANHPFYG